MAKHKQRMADLVAAEVAQVAEEKAHAESLVSGGSAVAEQDFIARLRPVMFDDRRGQAQVDGHDTHRDADDVLLEALRELGWAALADAYDAFRDEVGFWYS